MIKVKYNAETNLVEGYFPDTIDYKNNIIDVENLTIDGSPYIKITEQDHQDNFDKSMCVVNGNYQEYVKSSEELIADAKAVRCAEISKLRDQKIIEDSIRHNESNAAETAINALTSVEDIEGHDINQYFS